ncbi:Prefoldin subunit 1 [Halotydeus destructor]|nr:Prefoldin subunit 1 [Halotydeus destructor]
MAAVTVDLELKKHFEELQVQVIESRTKMRQLDLQVEGLKRTCQASMLTKRELSTLPEGSNTYESVGRMFIKRSLGEINNILDDRIKKNEEKAASLDSNKKYLETNLKERENNLRDLVAQKILKSVDRK